MKVNKIYLGLIACLLYTATSCEKYGYSFDNGYQDGDETSSPIGSDTSKSVVDRSLFDKARKYPGLVGNAVPRISDTTVIIETQRKFYSSQEYLTSVTPNPIFSTGLYAPAGEIVTIFVPEGVLGLTAQIGAHQDNLSGKDSPRRETLIFTQKELFPGENEVINLYGGLIWIRSNIQQSRETSLRFKGAVRTSDFILGVTDLSKWKEDVVNNDVPWLELRSKRTIYTVPRNRVVNFIQQGRADGVKEALEMWDDSYQHDYYDWMGMSENPTNNIDRYPALWERGIMDIQPSVGYAHSGQPWVMTEDDYWLDELINPVTVRNGASWGTYHEIGHNYQMGRSWSWSDLGEVTNNLFVFNAARRRGNNDLAAMHPNISLYWPIAMNYVLSDGAKNFSTFNGLYDAYEEGAVKVFGMQIPFLQIFNKAVGKNGETGWDFMTFIYKKARHERASLGLDQAKKDFFYRALCEFTGRDYARFFAQWGIPLSVKVRQDMRNAYPSMEKAIWEYYPLTRQGGDRDLPAKYDYDRIGWKVVASSDYPAEGGGNGIIAALTDGDSRSFWMSNPSITPPHTITIDMVETVPVKGVYVQVRDAGANVPRSYKLEVSTNGTTWTTVEASDLKSGSFILPNGVRSRQEITMNDAADVRFLRFTFSELSWNNGNFIGVAEIGAFFDN